MEMVRRCHVCHFLIIALAGGTVSVVFHLADDISFLSSGPSYRSRWGIHVVLGAFTAGRSLFVDPGMGWCHANSEKNSDRRPPVSFK